MSEFVVNDDMFGLYVRIPTGYSKEMHIYKVIKRFRSNTWSEIPLTWETEGNPAIHDCLEDVLNVVHCGVDESKVLKVALKDCEIVKKQTEQLTAKLDDCDKITLALKERGISIETIENYIKFEDECVKKGFSFKSLIEAREKQTAKRPYFEADGYYDGKLVYDTWICPNCGESYEAEYDECEYCPKCGQKIDWKEYAE